MNGRQRISFRAFARDPHPRAAQIVLHGDTLPRPLPATVMNTACVRLIVYGLFLGPQSEERS